LVNIRRVSISEHANQPISLIQPHPAFPFGLQMLVVTDSVHLHHHGVSRSRSTVIEQQPILFFFGLAFEASRCPCPPDGVQVKHL
ncbi:MAG TPA: hypothetical protein VL986_13730, partial [Terracidiphilus sp.]|nr:hypothetical protein [Terracidiphilus sp.]